MRLDALERTVAAERESVLSIREKTVSPEWAGRTPREIVAAGATLAQAPTPVMTLDTRALQHDLDEMIAWCARAGVQFAPHGKTTMSPSMWLDQLRAGAWGITVANEAQLRVAIDVGVPRVMLANMLLRPGALTWLADRCDADPELEVMVWVDSVDAVRIMTEALSAHGARRPLPVLVEVGSPGARTGARTLSDARAVADAVRASPRLALAGVSGYEGVIAHGTGAESLADVRAFLRSMQELYTEYRGSYDVPVGVLTAGGSSFFDLVAEEFADAVADPTTDVVVRSGAVVVHDDGIYTGLTPSATRVGPRLRAAMNVWCRVISVPEPAIAYLDGGRRDLPADEGWPVPLDLRRAGQVRPVVGAEVSGMNDQHTHVRLSDRSDVAVGDIVRLGVSHPCTTFDKWRWIVVVDDATRGDPQVVDIIRTHF